MRVVPIHPGEAYQDETGLQVRFAGTAAQYAVLNEQNRVVAIRRFLWMAEVVAAGCRQAQINGVDWRPAP